MNKPTMMTFWQLFDDDREVQIPKIQRDYAQGREDGRVKDIRENLLEALLDALKKSVGNPPLNLDFIFGVEKTPKKDGTKYFVPLDGQQRLTTLFLLHWYLAWRDDEFETFAGRLKAGNSSRFSYEIRPSSKDFFDKLVEFYPKVELDEGKNVVKQWIKDQKWYFLAWERDPTISSALVMLDAIHEKFSSTSDLFRRLTDSEHPAVTFQLLLLKDFDFPDELYIKMNARGKSLTSFEAFKARYEEKLRTQLQKHKFHLNGTSVTTRQYFASRIDNEWADLFWPYRDSTSKLYDRALMNLFRIVALVTRAPDASSASDDKGKPIYDIHRLEDSKTRELRFSDYESGGWLDEEFTRSLITLLDTWSGSNGKLNKQLPDANYEKYKYYDEDEFLGRIAHTDAFASGGTNPFPTQTHIVQFAAYLFFLKKHRQDLAKPECRNEFQDWMRVVRNLAVNTEFEKDMFRNSLGSLSNLVDASEEKGILRFLAESDDKEDDKKFTGFSDQQVAEEKLKAKLMLANGGWRELLLDAESHGYFQGQIEFLLDFCGVIKESKKQPVSDWDEQRHTDLQGKFSAYFEKAKAMFDKDGLVELDDFLWERALLCMGNYLLPRGRNMSLLVDSRTDQASWKRLLRGPSEKDRSEQSREIRREARGVLRKLLDEINLLDKINFGGDIAEQLDKLIANVGKVEPKPEPWRLALLRTPGAIEYCKKRCIRFKDEDKRSVFLMQRERPNAPYAELYTYALYLALEADGKEYAPPGLGYKYVTSNDGEQPHFYARLGSNEDGRQLRVFSADGGNGKFRMEYKQTSGNAVDVFELQVESQVSCLEGDREEVENVLQGLAKRSK